MGLDMHLGMKLKSEDKITEVMYWRKANAIHKWFVDNVQDGVDECQESIVSVEKLKELLEILRKVSQNDSLAPELLPTESGFFFGGTEYDDWYFEKIKETIRVLYPLVYSTETEEAEYFYRASW